MMEGIVYGIANIHFRQNLVEFQDENCTSNCTLMASPSEICKHSQVQEIEQDSSYFRVQDCPVNGTHADGDNNWEEADADGGDDCTLQQHGLTYGERRKLPARNSKDRSLLGTKRRTIMKPLKRVSLAHKEFNTLKPSEIKKLYMNKKLAKFRPANLETIVEEEPPDSQSNWHEEDKVNQTKFIGTRKLRRAVTFSDCFFVNKAVIKKRRAKIKKVIGRRPALKKISLEEFMDKLNKSIEQKNDISSNEMEDDCCNQNITIKNSNKPIECDGAMTDDLMGLKSANTLEVL